MPYDTNVTTAITQALFQAQVNVNFAFEEAHHFGCSEVGGLIASGFQKTIQAIFDEYDVTPAEYVSDLGRRGIRHKWMYFSGLSNTIDETVRDQDRYSGPNLQDERQLDEAYALMSA